MANSNRTKASNKRELVGSRKMVIPFLTSERMKEGSEVERGMDEGRKFAMQRACAVALSTNSTSSRVKLVNALSETMPCCCV